MSFDEGKTEDCQVLNVEENIAYIVNASTNFVKVKL